MGALLLLALGLALFSTGFLTMRRELPDVASCGGGDSGDACAPPEPTFDKAVLLVVDALREDFFFASQQEQQQQHGQAALPPQNDLPRLRKLVADAVSGACATGGPTAVRRCAAVGQISLHL